MFLFCLLFATHTLICTLLTQVAIYGSRCQRIKPIFYNFFEIQDILLKISNTSNSMCKKPIILNLRFEIPRFSIEIQGFRSKYQFFYLKHQGFFKILGNSKICGNCILYQWHVLSPFFLSEIIFLKKVTYFGQSNALLNLTRCRISLKSTFWLIFKICCKYFCNIFDVILNIYKLN